MNTNHYFPKSTVTVGIPTYYAGPALVEAVASLRASQHMPKDFRLIVTVDGNPLDPKTRAKLEKYAVEIIDNRDRTGQVGRIKQLIKLCRTDLLILTQDDILFHPFALRRIVASFEEKPVSMVGAHVLPAPETTLFEKVVSVGVRANTWLGEHLKQGDSMFLASGRCLAFTTKQAQALSIPDSIINSDAYLYFENKRCNGSFAFAQDAYVYNKNPQKLAEHLKQSRRFAISQRELQQFFPEGLANEYKLSAQLQATALLNQLQKQPFYTILYLFLFVYTHLAGRDMYKEATAIWDTDASTKRTAGV